MFYVVFIAPSPSFVCLSASCLSYCFDVVHYAFKNKIGNMLNNTQNLSGSNDRFGFIRVDFTYFLMEHSEPNFSSAG